MDPTLGARLRQQREERQVTLTTISTKTKIKVSLLEALESDDVSVWPKGLFGRAYLRDYANAVGIEPETVVSEFLALHPEFAYVTAEAEEAEAAARDVAENRSAASRFRRFVTSAFSPARPVELRMGTSTPPARAERPLFDTEDRRFDVEESMEGVIAAAETEILGTSMSHELAEAHERVAVPFAELDAREEVVDMGLQAALLEAARPEPEPEPAIAVSVKAAPREISLASIADVCSRLARAMDFREVTTLLNDAARLLDAVGVIVWQWDGRTAALRPSLACGYPDAVIARLPEVRTGDANAVATAFRSGEQCIVDGIEGTEAVVVPSLGVGGCVAVLAVELRPGTRERESICAFATILAAQLAMLLPSPEPVEA